MEIRSRLLRGSLLLFFALALPIHSWAETGKRVGGHIGAVVPLVTRADGNTTTVADDFVIGFPAGIGVWKAGRLAVDLEVVPVFQNKPANLSMDVHPGVILRATDSLAAGVRAAFDVEGNAWGFTPLLNRALYSTSSHTVFGEVVLPVRFVDNGASRQTNVTLGVHIGVGF
jgi:hypothetical protein